MYFYTILIFLLLNLVFNVVENTKVNIVKRHTPKNSSTEQQRYEKIETREVQDANKSASEGDLYTSRDEPDLAAHSYSVGAEKLEAASNVAGVISDSKAIQRHNIEHKLSKKLQDLAERNIEISANVEPNKSIGDTDSKKSTDMKKEDKKGEKKEAKKDEKPKNKGWLKPSDKDDDDDENDDED